MRATLGQRPLDGREFRRLMDGRLKEGPWQKQVEEALTTSGWWWMHIPPNVVICPCCGWRIFRGIRKGFPDILAIRPPRKLWIELKTERGQPKPEQRHVRDMLLACGETFVQARPRDREQLFELIR